MDPADALHLAMDLAEKETPPEDEWAGGIDASAIEPDLDLLTLPPGYIEPWTRKENETEKAWGYFEHFRDAGPERTFVGTAKHFGLHEAFVSKIAAKYRWRDRALAWDRHMDRVYRISVQRAVREMAQRHASQVVESLGVLALPFQAIQRKLEENPDFLDELAGTDIRRLFDMALRSGKILPMLMSAERLARGMPTEIVQAEGEVRHVHELREADPIAAVLSILERNRLLPGGGRTGGSGEVVDAEVVEMDDDLPVGAEGQP